MKNTLMKKTIIALLAVLMTLVMLTGAAIAAEADKTADALKIAEVPERKIVLDGVSANFSNVPLAIDGRTMLPLRELVTALGVPNDDEHIIYKRVSKDEQYVSVIYGQTRIDLTIGEPAAYVDGKRLTLDAPPVIYKNSTYIPLRFVAEALGKKVVWVGETKTVLIVDQESYDAISGIMRRFAEAKAGVSRYRMEIDIASVITRGESKADVSIKENTFVDRVSELIYKETQLDIFGIEMEAKAYYKDNIAYSSDPLTGQWKKRAYTPEEFSQLFETMSDVVRSEEDERLNASLRIEESENEDELVLIGSIDFTGQLAEAYRQQSELLGAGTFELPETGVFTLRLVFDRETYMLRSYTAEASVEGQGPDVNTSVDVSLSIVYSDIDGDFEISVPENVIENAVEDDPEASGAASGF